MLGFAAEPIPVVRVGFVGLGMRGPGAIKRFVNIEGAEIAALCDSSVFIPMQGGAESLNAAVEAAIFMYKMSEER